MQSEEEQYSSIILNIKQIIEELSKNILFEKWYKDFEDIKTSTDNEKVRNILKTLIDKENKVERKEFIRALLETQKIDIEKAMSVIIINEKVIEEKKKIEKNNDEENITYLLEIVDNDYKKFINLLLHTGQYALALILDPNIRDVIDFSQCDPSKGYVSHFSFGGENPNEEFYVKKGKTPNSKTNAYGMKGDPKGICYLLINYLTIATYKEMQRFRNIFHKLKFKVIMRKNMNAIELNEELKKLSQRDVVEEHKAFIFMSISHGNHKREIYGFDKKPIKMDDIINLFNNKNCPQLLRKPKLFFFNCCRGPKRDPGVDVSLDASEGTNADGELFISQQWTSEKVPKIDNVSIIYSTLYGYKAQVKWNEGTIFGKVLADSIIERVIYKDINGLLNLANRKLENDYPNIRQRFESINKGTRDMFFITE